MKEEIYEEQRPTLRIEQPPEWWVQQRKREIEVEEKDNDDVRLVIIDMNSGEEKSEKDINGVIVINM